MALVRVVVSDKHTEGALWAYTPRGWALAPSYLISEILGIDLSIITKMDAELHIDETAGALILEETEELAVVEINYRGCCNGD